MPAPLAYGLGVAALKGYAARTAVIKATPAAIKAAEVVVGAGIGVGIGVGIDSAINGKDDPLDAASGADSEFDNTLPCTTGRCNNWGLAYSDKKSNVYNSDSAEEGGGENESGDLEEGQVEGENAPTLKGRRPKTPEYPVKNEDGSLTEYGEWYYDRPSGYRDGKRQEVWDEKASESIDGKVRDPNTGEELSPDELWDMGHKPGYEFKKHKKSAADREISREEFLDEHNTTDHYQPESPSSNRGHSGEAADDVYHGF